MREISDKEIQSIELNILKYIKKVCEEHEIRYYLAYGTLIGAIRHNGFIPWDDDIDIMMPRPDYLKFIQAVKNDSYSGNYRVVSIDTVPNFTAPLPKIIDTSTRLVQHYGLIEKVELGVYVDIFLIDGAGNDYSKSLKRYDKAYDLYKRWIRADSKMIQPGISKFHSIYRWMKNLRYKIKGYSFWLNTLEDYCKSISYNDSEYVSVLEAGTPGAKRNVWPKNYFGSGIDVSFEGTLFKAPLEYDKMLRGEYGDYMTPPPIEEQISHHYSDIYWK